MNLRGEKQSLKKRIFLFLIFTSIMLMSDALQATEFKVKMFTKASNDLSARLMQYKRLDDNDLVCAIIKVRSDIEGLKFTASTPIVGNVEKRFGEYWVYVSGGTRQLSIYADGYIKLSYTFPERIEPATVYIMEVTSQQGTLIDSGKGNLIINSEPSGVEVRIDGFPDLKKITPCKFENYRSGIYSFKFIKNRYLPFDTIISIDKNATKQVFVKLHPVWGDLTVITNVDSAEFQIDGKTFTGSLLNLAGEENGLKEGIYPLKISSKNYYDTVINVAVKSESKISLEIKLKPVKTSVEINSVPSGAKIFIDGVDVGYTPYSGNLIIGKHTLFLSKAGYINEKRTINLEKDIPFSLTVPLRTNAKVTITSYPDGAKIYLNGKYMGRTPEKINIYTGDNTIRLEKKNYKTLTDNIIVVPDTTYWFQLTEQTYQLVINSNPQDADISINGKYSGTTKKSFDLKYGSYKVKLSKKGYVTRRRSFTLNKNKKLFVNLPKRISGFVGATFFAPAEEYDLYKYGAELGWSYQKIPHLLTSVGIAYGEDSEFDNHLKDWEIKQVSEVEYKDLHFNTLTPSDFAVRSTNVWFWRFGWIIYKPFVFSLNTIMGVFSYKGYYVYTAEKDYDPEDSFYAPLWEGSKFVERYGETEGTKFKYGFGAILKLSNFYMSCEYWPPSNSKNYGTRFSFGVGIML